MEIWGVRHWSNIIILLEIPWMKPNIQKHETHKRLQNVLLLNDIPSICMSSKKMQSCLDREKTYLKFITGLSVDKDRNKHWISIFSRMVLFPYMEPKPRGLALRNLGYTELNHWNSLFSLAEVLKKKQL